MKVKNHKEFACFDYVQNTDCKDIRKLGQIVKKPYTDEIGIIIQVHDDGEFRTDMFGNCCYCEIIVATISDIKRLRPDIL